MKTKTIQEIFDLALTRLPSHQNPYMCSVLRTLATEGLITSTEIAKGLQAVSKYMYWLWRQDPFCTKYGIITWNLLSYAYTKKELQDNPSLYKQIDETKLRVLLYSNWAARPRTRAAAKALLLASRLPQAN